MNDREYHFPVWIVAFGVLTLMTAFLASDAGGIAQQIRTFELDCYRHLLRPGFSALPEPAVSLFGQGAFLVIAGGGLIAFLGLRYWIAAIALTLTAILAAQGLSWFLFVERHVMVDSLNPSIALFLAFLAAMAARGFERLHDRSDTGHVFAGMLPPAALEMLARHPNAFKSQGEARIVTCLSCGVRGYSALARSFAEDTAGFARLIDDAMARLTAVVAAQGATIGRFDGSSFMAYWNAPFDDADHAAHACEAAGSMVAALADLNERRASSEASSDASLEAVEIDIGIATGPAIVGLYHLGDRKFYCVTGDSIMLADTIRSLSVRYGPTVIASEATRTAAQQAFAFLEVDYIACGPREDPARLYALLGNLAVRSGPKFRAVATFHDHIFKCLHAQQWEKARALIEQCRKLSGASQQVYDLHLARIAWFEANPPAPDWDGAFRPVLN